jgi:hypothetical protein
MSHFKSALATATRLMTEGTIHTLRALAAQTEARARRGGLSLAVAHHPTLMACPRLFVCRALSRGPSAPARPSHPSYPTRDRTGLAHSLAGASCWAERRARRQRCAVWCSAGSAGLPISQMPGPWPSSSAAPSSRDRFLYPNCAPPATAAAAWGASFSSSRASPSLSPSQSLAAGDVCRAIGASSFAAVGSRVPDGPRGAMATSASAK